MTVTTKNARERARARKIRAAKKALANRLLGIVLIIAGIVSFILTPAPGTDVESVIRVSYIAWIPMTAAIILIVSGLYKLGLADWLLKKGILDL